MTALTVIIPTIGRRSLAATIESFAPQLQPGDRVQVACDDHERYDFCCQAVQFGRDASHEETIWRCYLAGDEPLGRFGHPARNEAIDFLATLNDRPSWCWTLDDDDVATFGALDMIRAAVETGAAKWYVFRMRGGEGSLFPGVTVPVQNVLRMGNVGTPMMVFPTSTRSRFGLGKVAAFGVDQPEGYFGDWAMASALRDEYGAPVWVNTTVAEIRPEKVEA